MKRALSLFAALLLCLLCAAAAGEDTVLSVGDKGQEVKEVKLRLQELRYLGSGSVTKEFNRKTEDAVREFQKRNGLPETGTVERRHRRRCRTGRNGIRKASWRARGNTSMRTMKKGSGSTFPEPCR